MKQITGTLSSSLQSPKKTSLFELMLFGNLHIYIGNESKGKTGRSMLHIDTEGLLGTLYSGVTYI